MTGPVEGDPFGPYLLRERLGAGGMGEVHRAWDTRRTRHVALKRLLGGYTTDRGFAARFRREAALVARLAEPHVIPVHDFGEIDGRLFLDMRLVDGLDAAALLAREGALHPARAVALVSQVASALDAAHAEGLVHRDVKPSNILVTGGSEFCYLVDFGVVRAIDGTGSTSLTLTGSSVGTPPYMAPERFLDEPDRPSVDVYALGCVLYELLTGERPFRSDELPQQIEAHLHHVPPAPSDRVRGLPPALDAVVATALAKRPDERHPSAGALARAAQEALGHRSPGPPVTITAPGFAGPVASPAAGPGTARRRRRVRTGVAAAVTVVVAAAVSAVVVSGRDGAAPPAPSPVVALGTAERTVPVGRGPNVVAVSPDGAEVYVGNRQSKSVTVIDAATGGVRATWPLSTDAGGIAISPDGAAAAVVVADALLLIETDSGTTTATIPVDNSPRNVVLDAGGRTAYVAQEGAVARVDLDARRVVDRVVADAFGGGLVLAPDGRRLYATSGGMRLGTLSVVDTASLSVIATIRTGDTSIVPAVSPDGRRVYVPNEKTSTLAVVDTTSLTSVATVRLPTGPSRAIPAPDGRRVYVLRYGDPHYALTVLDAATNAVVGDAPLAVAADGSAVSADGRRLFVTAPDADALVVTATGV